MLLCGFVPIYLNHIFSVKKNMNEIHYVVMKFTVCLCLSARNHD